MDKSEKTGNNSIINVEWVVSVDFGEPLTEDNILRKETPNYG